MTEFYIRNLSKAEIAVYAGNQSIKFWNIWGSDNVGRIESGGDKKFYIKDHLGSVRCVLDASSNILSSQDFDAWGHKINGRSYIADKPNKYQFTSKERDLESDYDYFGARYYDSKIGRWGGVDPLLHKHFNFNPYNYVLDNPLILKDPNGKQIYFSSDSDQREKEISIIQSLLDNIYKDYITAKINDNGVYILNASRLQSNPFKFETSEFYENLLEIATSSQKTQIFLVDDKFEITATSTEDNENSYAHLGINVVKGKVYDVPGLTIYSGTSKTRIPLMIFQKVVKMKFTSHLTVRKKLKVKL